jgi:uncharacterized membrane protein YbhN (UPF0104 family)
VLRVAIALAFLGAVGWLLARYARSVDWNDVLATLRDYRPSTLALAVALAATSYGLHGAFGLFGRHFVGHRLPVARTWAIEATAYAFNVNLGALVGGIGMRVRLYSRHGLGPADVARSVAVAVTVNWLGYVGLAGAAFASGLVDVPPDWRIGGDALRLVGVGMLAAFGGALAACALSRTRTWTVRGHEIPVPTLRMALLQATVSIANWLTISTLIWVLLSMRVPLATVVAVTLTASIAGAMTHVPAGLGVLETVFVVLLGDRVPPAQLLAALLAYRAIYYLGPLVVAAVAWPWLEASAATRRVADAEVEERDVRAGRA